MSQQHAVVIDLDFTPNLITPFHSLLVNKLRAPLRVGFSNKFEHCGYIPAANRHRPGCPDVKISYHSNCIIVLEYYSNRIQFYDLNSKRLLTFIKAKQPRCLCVEENYDKQKNDAIIYNRDCHTKYDIKELIKQGLNSSDDCNPLWVQDLSTSSMNGIAVSRTSHGPCCEKFIYCCASSSGCVIILNANNGQQVGQISTIPIPYGIDVTEKGDLIISSLGGQIQLFTEPLFQPHSFRNSKIILSEGILHSPRGICYDPVAKHIIICDTLNYLVVVMDLEGKILKSFADRTTLSYPYGVCVNSLNGKVYVSNWSLEGVQIFK
ncbi:hypothetical protein C9374_007331 [Naegleria lovaniensis]|uniref:Uncharacterized protein n=1 Tax=Naegleria lovaniensis TaxID=51637 RepID=A0AA88GGU4_NAELO|nr:uncharacterized protein C9374_007331 [Naegleria lovaniensis]KAG2379192.1 hypothetical protein C9374_007331 [Naegleria lovaniensis]